MFVSEQRRMARDPDSVNFCAAQVVKKRYYLYIKICALDRKSNISSDRERAEIGIISLQLEYN